MIVINGYNVGFKFNINHAIESIGFVKGVATTSSLTYAMLYTGYKAWCFVRQINEAVTMEQLVDWCEDDENSEKVKEIVAELEQSKLFQVVSDIIAGLVKKNEPELRKAS